MNERSTMFWMLLSVGVSIQIRFGDVLCFILIRN